MQISRKFLIKLFIIHEQRQYSMEKIYTFGFRLSNNQATDNEKLIRTKYIFSTIEFIHITSILCSRLAKRLCKNIDIKLNRIEFSYCVYLLSIYLHVYKHIRIKALHWIISRIIGLILFYQI